MGRDEEQWVAGCVPSKGTTDTRRAVAASLILMCAAHPLSFNACVTIGW